MAENPAFFISRDSVKQDPALLPGARGARKLLVTELVDSKEFSMATCEWSPPKEGEKCGVRVMPDTEMAIFNRHAKQDRHYHKKGTEIFMVLEGSMTIEVENSLYTLTPGDLLAVNPNAAHQVKADGADFLCRVLTVNCGGASDKFIV